MCTGIAIALGELPNAFAEDMRLTDRLYKREGRDEFQFHWWQSPAFLPVQWEGVLQLLPWGSRNRRGGLPYGGWIPRTDLEHGMLGSARTEDVVIPANLGYHHGTWFLIVEGIRGILVRDRTAGPVVYMITEPSTNYYRNMTEQEPMMPELIGQVI